MGFGLKVMDTAGKTAIITPSISNIVSSGTITMPTTLHWNNTYGADIDLPGNDPYRKGDIGVLIKVRFYEWDVAGVWFIASGGGGNEYGLMKYIDIASNTYYTRNDANGAMSIWTPIAYDDTQYNCFPVAFWDTLGQSVFTSVRLFAAMCYFCYDVSHSTYKEVYTIDDIYYIDYVVYLKNLQEER